MAETRWRGDRGETHGIHRVFLVSVAALAAAPARAEALFVIEAENCEHSGGAASRQDAIWCSGRGVVGDFWGERPGDRIQFTQTLSLLAEDLKLAVRYSFFEDHCKGFRGLPAAGDGVLLRVDGATTIPLPMKDTGNWHRFGSAISALPPLAAGPHTFALESAAPNSVRNIDAFIFSVAGLRKSRPPCSPPPSRAPRTDAGRFRSRPTSA